MSATDEIRRLARVLTVNEAADIAAVSADTIRRAYNATAEPFLKHMRIGSRIRILPADLADWLDQLRADS